MEANLHSMKSFVRFLLVLVSLLGAAGAQAATCPALLAREMPRLQDEKPQSLCQYAGKVVLVVNTASFCGFTSQYKGLEDLYAKYRDRGLVVLGFPSNDFGAQEPGSNGEIAKFCEGTFGVKFPMFTKTRVSARAGSGVNPLFSAHSFSPAAEHYRQVTAAELAAERSASLHHRASVRELAFAGKVSGASAGGRFMG
jgi:glutathione peroxidase-family protein